MLLPKIQVSTLNRKGTLVTLHDVTGVYSTSNPGGYGGPNHQTNNIDWVLLTFKNFRGSDKVTRLISDPSPLFVTGLEVQGIVDGKFQDGVTEIKYHVVVGNPVQENVDTAITWVPGSKVINLLNAQTVLQGATAVLIKDISQEMLYTIDPTVPLGSSSFTVLEPLPGVGSGTLAVAYEGTGYLLSTAAGEACIHRDTGVIITTCGCDSVEMRELHARYAKLEATRIFFESHTIENYYAAHELAVQLEQYCDQNAKCNC